MATRLTANTVAEEQTRWVCVSKDEGGAGRDGSACWNPLSFETPPFHPLPSSRPERSGEPGSHPIRGGGRSRVVPGMTERGGGLLGRICGESEIRVTRNEHKNAEGPPPCGDDPSVFEPRSIRTTGRRLRGADLADEGPGHGCGRPRLKIVRHWITSFRNVSGQTMWGDLRRLGRGRSQHFRAGIRGRREQALRPAGVEAELAAWSPQSAGSAARKFSDARNFSGVPHSGLPPAVGPKWQQVRRLCLRLVSRCQEAFRHRRRQWRG